MTKVRLPDGSVKEFDKQVTVKDVAKSIGSRLAKAALWAEVNDQPVKLDFQIPTGDQVDLKIVTKTDEAALPTLRHSCAHVMARAVMKMRDNVQLAFGPSIDNGFYYDIMCDPPLSEEEFPAIEAEMQKIIELDEPFERIVRDRDAAVQICKDMKQEFKVEHVTQGLAKDETLSFYQQGEFLDLCRGPHIPTPKSIGAFKIMSIAGAYWKGDQSREQLQRLYATAFFKQKDLDEHLVALEEAKKRDHRVLGRKLGLFHIDEMVGQGLILWTPKGAFVRQQLQDFISAHLRRQGYDQVFTPHIGKLELYKTSGHFPYYQESQYPALIDREHMSKLAKEGCSCSDLSNMMEKGEIEGYLLKPMNCPHHVKIYGSQQRSYRDLPIRLAEFGTVYRYEQSGEIGGLTRVRGFTQDDAHLFVTQEQLADEIAGCLELVKVVFATMGMENYSVRVGLRDPDSSKYVGDPENWDLAEKACRDAASSLGKPFKQEPGEAAFYGPKIDFVVKDCIDYNLPVRFDLSYTGADNQQHRPVMIHRAPFGSMERFIGVLIEHFGGTFPLWLAPEQARILTVSNKAEPYARQVEEQMISSGLRVTGDYRSEKLGSKIRDGRHDLLPYLMIIGPRDADQGTVSIRDRYKGDLGAIPVAQAISMMTEEVASKVVREYETETA